MEKMDSIKKKIRYRAEYRGIKEMDILLSAFVKKYIDNFNYEELSQLFEILELDDDIKYKWYSSKDFTDKFPENEVTNLLKNFKFD